MVTVTFARVVDTTGAGESDDKDGKGGSSEESEFREHG